MLVQNQGMHPVCAGYMGSSSCSCGPQAPQVQDVAASSNRLRVCESTIWCKLLGTRAHTVQGLQYPPRNAAAMCRQRRQLLPSYAVRVVQVLWPQVCSMPVSVCGLQCTTWCCCHQAIQRHIAFPALGQVQHVGVTGSGTRSGSDAGGMCNESWWLNRLSIPECHLPSYARYSHPCVYSDQGDGHACSSTTADVATAGKSLPVSSIYVKTLLTRSASQHRPVRSMSVLVN